MSNVFDDAFVRRLSEIAAKIDAEDMLDDPPDPHERVVQAEVEEMFEKDGGDLEAAKKKIEELHLRRDHAFADIVQCLSDNYALGPIDRLAEKPLEDLVREACEAADTWAEDVEMEDDPPTPKTPLQQLLASHHELGESILDVEDEISEPYVKLSSDGEDGDGEDGDERV